MALLFPLPFLVSLLSVSNKRSNAALKVPATADFADLGMGAGKRTGPFWPLLLLWLIWLLTITALMRPQWIGDPVELPVSGRDLLLAVDISGSMGQQDMELNGNRVSRLAVIKKVVSDFILARTSDRIGLILFGTQAYLQAPLTFDRTTVGQLLEEIPIAVAGGKTAIGDAIGLAVKQLIHKKEGDRILILLTDGANNVGALNPVKAARLAAQENIRIYTVGVGGNRAATSPSDLFFNFSFPLAGSDLDEDTLREISKITGGHYFHADSTKKLVQIYELLNQYEPVLQPEEVYRPTWPLGHYPLGLAFALSLMLAVWWLRNTENRARQHD